MDLTVTTTGRASHGRYITGMLVPHGETGATSMGRVQVAPGAIQVPDDPTRVPLLRGHDRDAPIGALLDATSGPAGIRGVFRLADTEAADLTAAELAGSARTGLSVELADVELDTTTDPPTVTAAQLVACASLPVPAFDTARAELAAARHDTERSTTMDTAPATTPDLTAADAPPAPAAAPPAALAAARTAPVSPARMLAERVAAAYTSGGSGAAGAVLTAALADITPTGNGAGNDLAALGVQAAGELTDELPAPLFESCVTARPLTGMRVRGWRWSTPPKVGDYAGNKADVPSNAAKMEYVEVSASRLAGAHDLDRIYVDLGASEALVSYWRLMMGDVAAQLDAKRLAAVQADAATGTAPDAATALLDGLAAVPDATYWIVSADVAKAEGAKPAEQLPSILSGEGPFGRGLPGAPIVSDTLPDGTVIVGRRSARDFYALQPPIRLEAVNVAKAGVDAGAYSYYAPLTVAAAGVHVATITPAAATGRGR